MATGGSEVMSDEIVFIKFYVCREKGRTSEAAEYCYDCKDYYCSRCNDVHTIIPDLKQHKLLDKSDSKLLGPDGSLPSFPTERCLLHQSELINMYCKNHDTVACTSCIAATHSSCGDVLSIPDQVENLYNRTQLNLIKQKITSSKKSIDEFKNSMGANIEDLKTSYDKAVKAVKEFRQEIAKLLDNMEQESLKELKNKYDTKEDSVTKKQKEAEDILGALNEVTSKLQKSEGNKAQELVTIKLNEKVTSTDKLQALLTPMHAALCFVADTGITGYLNTFKALGAILDTTIQFSPKASLYKLKKQREINVKLEIDNKDCRIYGSCVTADGFLLLTDAYNNKLKRLDMSTETVKDYISLASSPSAVCQVGNTEVAVTMCNKSIQFVSLGSKLTTTRCLKMDHFCLGLAYVNGKFFISDQGKTVFIYNMKGEKLKEVTDILQQTRHITVGVGEDRVSLVGNDNDLVILDLEGKHLNIFKYPNLSSTQGVCTDGRNMFICGYSSNHIVQIGPDNQLLGEIARVTSPLSIAFDPQRTRLIVTKDGDNNITVVDLE